MNSYALIPFLAFLFNAFVWVYVFAQRRRTLVSANVAYLHLTAAFAFWALASFVTWSPVPDSWRYAVLRLMPITWSSLGFYSLGFVYTLLGLPRNPVFWAFQALHILAIGISLFTDWIYTGYHLTYWGTQENFGPLFYPILITNVVIPVTYALRLLAVRYRTAVGDERGVIRLLLAGAVGTFLLSMVFDVVMPRVLDIRSVPEFGSSVTVVMVIFVYRAVVRHNFLNVSLEETAIDIFEKALDGILIEDSRRGALAANRAARSILRLEKMPRSASEIPELRGIRADPEQQVTQQVSFERDGRRTVLSVSSAPIMRSSEARGRLIVLRDITEEKRAEEERARLEEQLRQSQKLEAIGTLAGGVAHDMNNVLAGIMGFASVIKDELPENHPLASDVREILAAARRGRDLTKDLLGFARKGKYRKKAVSLNAIVRELLPLLERTISRKIRIHFRPDPGIPPTECDPGQISHAVMNLALNAADAMPDGGDLVIETGAVSVDDAAAGRSSGLGRGEYVRVAVTDTGTGMTDAVRERAFEPFFTTKQPGKGTGLGLSMVYGTVENHGGRVTIESAPGKGTAITVLLPARRDAALKEEREASLPAPKPDGDGGTVLLVDDELLVREAGKRILERLGYDVLLARNGEDALDLYQKKKGGIRFVILDLVMPEIDGAECLRRILRIDPGARVLLSSGFSRNEETETLLKEGAIGFLPKPFEMAQLAEALAGGNRSGEGPAA